MTETKAYHDTRWTLAAREVLRNIQAHLTRMEGERNGWGPEAMAAVHRTENSLLWNLMALTGAENVWADSHDGLGLSLEGMMPGGLTFGMVARVRDLPEHGRFHYAEVEWTMHS